MGSVALWRWYFLFAPLVCNLSTSLLGMSGVLPSFILVTLLRAIQRYRVARLISSSLAASSRERTSFETKVISTLRYCSANLKLCHLRGKFIGLRGGEKTGVSFMVEISMGGCEPPILALASVGGLVGLFATAKGYQGTVFFGIEGDLAGLVSLGLNDLD